MLLSMAANLLIVGPLDVGLPVLAFSRLPEGAAAFGLILSAFGGGSLLGMAGATLLPALPRAHFGSAILLLISLTGVGMVAMAFVYSTPVALAIAAGVGIVLGYTNIAYMTWVQRRIPRNLMGRVMSMIMFSSMALVPVSMAVAGAVVTVSLTGMLFVAGIGMTILSLSALLSGSVRHMGLEPPLDEEGHKADEAAAAETTSFVPASATD